EEPGVAASVPGADAEVAPLRAEPRPRGLGLDLEAVLAQAHRQVGDEGGGAGGRLLDVAVELELGERADEADRLAEEAAAAGPPDPGDVGELLVAGAEDQVVDALAGRAADRRGVALD